MHIELHNYLFQDLLKAKFMNMFWIFFLKNLLGVQLIFHHFELSFWKVLFFV